MPYRRTTVLPACFCVGMVVFVGAGPLAAAGDLVINEFMASNTNVVRDPQGQFEDWIEIHNAGQIPVDLGGMYVTDNIDRPTKWCVPTDRPAETTIAPGDFLLIWADKETQHGGLHAGFKLDNEGEEIALFDRDGQSLMDSVHFGTQRANVSFGRFPDGGDDWGFLTAATPSGRNLSTFEGWTPAPTISYDRGFCDEPFVVEIYGQTDDTLIVYTLDGSDPYDLDTGAPGGLIYEAPLTIEKTTCLRAMAWRVAWMPSRTESRTYLFVEDVIGQSPHGEAPRPGWPTGQVQGQRIDYGMDPDIVNHPDYADLMNDALLAIPTLSFATDLKHLFDPATGIYVHCGGYTGERGPEWERPVSVELMYPDGQQGFQANAGLRMRGITSCRDSNPKHAFRLFFESPYGDGELRYPLFGDEGAETFNNVDLRCAANYSWNNDGAAGARNTFVREVFCRDLQREMGQPYTRSRYYHLYINGQYWGLYQTQERAEASYAATYFGGDEEDYDVVKTDQSWPRRIEVTDGTLDAYQRLRDAAMAGFETDEAYYRIQGLNPDGTANPAYERLIDVGNLIDYMLTIFYTGDFDAPITQWYSNRAPNNFYAVFNRIDPDGFKYFRHDAEHVMMDLREDRTGPFTHPDLDRLSGFNPQTLHQKLTAHPEYRMRLADRIHRFLFNAGPMTPEKATDLLLARIESIRLAVIAESARWGDAQATRPRTANEDWASEIGFLLDSYLPERTDIVLDQLRARGWYPHLDAPEYRVVGRRQHGGNVSAGQSITMEAPAGTIYYTADGTDPRRPASADAPHTGQILVPEDARKTVWVPDGDIGTAWAGGTEPFDDAHWITVEPSPSTGTGAVGYDQSPDYRDHITLDVEPLMYGTNASCYVRIPFDVAQDTLDSINTLTLRVRCDDGFVAYLNGVEVTSLGKPTSLTWNSTCPNRRDATEFADFALSHGLEQLTSGPNLLAVHAMNQSTTSSDFLISVELRAGSAAPESRKITDGAVEYLGPLSPDFSAILKARAWHQGAWSALSEATFVVGEGPLPVRITEIMYHPQDTGRPDDPNTEFIELKNTGDRTINLNLLSFTAGIRFVFPPTELSAGGYVLVVNDRDAFETKYGPGHRIAGVYEGRLANGGERIELRDPTGTVIHDFRYYDDWYNSTDGGGFSLTVTDPEGTDPGAWGLKSTWRPSLDRGGSPGTSDVSPVGP